MSARAFVLFVVYYFNPLHKSLAIDTRDHDVRTDCLMLFYLLPDALSLAPSISFAFYWLVLANLRVSLDFRIT